MIDFDLVLYVGVVSAAVIGGALSWLKHYASREFKSKHRWLLRWSTINLLLAPWGGALIGSGIALLYKWISIG